MHIAQKAQPLIVSVLALASLLPLQLLIFGDDMMVLHGQLAGIMYVMVLLLPFFREHNGTLRSHRKPHRPYHKPYTSNNAMVYDSCTPSLQ